MAVVVGILTDFGWGVYAGILRALGKCLGVDVVDIDHDVPSFSVVAGAYLLYNSVFWLPRGSGVAAVIDPGVGSSRRALLVVTKHYFIAAPDNGVAAPAAEEDGVVAVYRLDEARVIAESRKRCQGPPSGWRLSSTFHGRDVFLPAAALAALGVEPSRLGFEIDPDSVASLSLEWSEERGEKLIYKVLYIDKFGNIALSSREKPPAPRYLVSTPYGELVASTARTFSDVSEGEGVIYLNSFGFLEVAINKGNASKKLGVRVGDEVTLTPIGAS